MADERSRGREREREFILFIFITIHGRGGNDYPYLESSDRVTMSLLYRTT